MGQETQRLGGQRKSRLKIRGKKRKDVGIHVRGVFFPANIFIFRANSWEDMIMQFRVPECPSQNGVLLKLKYFAFAHLSAVCCVEVICVLQRCPSPSVGRDRGRVVVVLVEGGGGGVLVGVAVDQGLAVGLEIEKKNEEN